ncbi:MAG: TatD family hydrolase [Thermoguttaceae bacterium]
MPIPIFDTHAHLDLAPFSDDLENVLSRIETASFVSDLVLPELSMLQFKMTGVLLPGINLLSCQKSLAIARRSNKFCVGVAVHPNETANISADDWEQIVELAERSDVCAIGETGLDRYWNDSPIETQQDFLGRHIALAKRLDKPLLIHCRDAWNDLKSSLEHVGDIRCVIHAFSGTPEEANWCIQRGFYLSFAGSLTYRNKKFSPIWESVRSVPSKQLLIETDAPFMPPHPFRGKLEKNEPMYAAVVAARIAELRGESLEEIAEITSQNAKLLFV